MLGLQRGFFLLFQNRRAVKRTLLGCYLGQDVDGVWLASDVLACMAKILNE